MNGFEAIARGIRNSTDNIYAVPGFPVTELCKETGAAIVTNEKVGVEYALGHSLMGERAAIVMKSVGLNACADPLVQATTQGLVGGVVIVSGDDPEARGSTNAQDSRYYGELAQIPVIEPGPDSCTRGIEAAFRASESFSRICLVRVTPALLSGQVMFENIAPCPGKGRLADPNLTMRGRVQLANSYDQEMAAWSSTSDLNRLQGGDVGVGEVSGHSHLVTVFPPPDMLAGCSTIHEIGRPFVRDHRNQKPDSTTDEYETVAGRGYFRTFCTKCPFLTVMTVLRDKEMKVIVDAGCSILAMNPPFRIGVASYGLGTAIGVAARSTKVALIGDYAMIHSGLQSLVDVYERQLPLLCIVLDNRCLGMTGGQAALDPGRYLSWADPVVIDGIDREKLGRVLVSPDKPVTVIVRGTCPPWRHHETLAC